jgi:DHA2 family multidrug resistance protein
MAWTNPAVSSFCDLSTAAGASALNNEIDRQASMIAYLDDFYLMLVMTVLVMPLIFFNHANEG